MCEWRCAVEGLFGLSPEKGKVAYGFCWFSYRILPWSHIFLQRYRCAFKEIL